MIYVFDTSSIRSLQHFYPTIFTSIWDQLDELVASKSLISTREVYNEIIRQSVTKEIIDWVKQNKSLFTTPSSEELLFVAEILKQTQFQGLIGQKQRLTGMPVADPFLISCAKVHNGTVVTEEGWDHSRDALEPKKHASKIPNVCEYYHIGCVNLEEFMRCQQWTF